MKPILLFAFLLGITNAWGNPTVDSLPGMINRSPLHEQNHRPIFRLTAKDIAHLPFGNLMEALNGRFPFVFADPPSAGMYTFLIDGYVALNPNAINIAQIELIEFYPVSFDAASGSLSSRGTFVITTKKGPAGTSGLIIRSQTGLHMPNEKTSPAPGPGTKRETENEFSTYQEMGYYYNKGKLQLNVGGSFSKDGTPSYNAIGDTYKQNFSDNAYRQRLSVFGAYQASARLRVSLALLGTFKQNISDGKIEHFVPAVSSEYDSEISLGYGGAAIGVHYNNQFFTNSFQVEYTRLTRQTEVQYTNLYPPPGQTLLQHDDLHTRYSRAAIVNTTKGIFNSFGKVHLGWQLTLGYHEFRNSNDFTTITSPVGGPPTINGSFTDRRNERTLAAMPGLSVDVNRQFFAQAGVVFDSWKNSANPDPQKDLVIPYGGVRWVVPVKRGRLSSLQLHSTFGKSLQFYYRNDLLDRYPFPGSSSLQGPQITYGNPAPGYSWITGINAGFAKDKLLVSVNYLRGDGFPPIYRPAPWGGLLVNFEEVKRSGVSLDVIATFAETKILSCKFRTMLFYEQIELKDGKTDLNLYLNNPFLNDDLSPQLRGTASLDMTAGNFFMQVQGLLRFRDEGYNEFVSTGKRRPDSNHGLNFLVLGYSVPLKGQDKQFDISIQTRNLLVMKARANDYYGTRYVGLGVNLEL